MKNDLRKKIKLEIEITPYYLNLLEDFIVCIPLCDKHKGQIPVDDNMWQKCKDCEKIFRKWRNGSLQIWSKLVDSHLERYGDTYRD